MQHGAWNTTLFSMAEPYIRPYPRRTFTHSWTETFACLNDDATCSASLRTIEIIQRLHFDRVIAVPRTKRFRCRIGQHLFVRAVFPSNFAICDGFTRHMVSNINVLRVFPTYFCPLWALLVIFVQNCLVSVNAMFAQDVPEKTQFWYTLRQRCTLRFSRSSCRSFLLVRFLSYRSGIQQQ